MLYQCNSRYLFLLSPHLNRLRHVKPPLKILEHLINESITIISISIITHHLKMNEKLT